MGTQHPQQGGTAARHFSYHVYCGQTAAWVKMPLGMEVGLGPAHVALWDLAPPDKGAQQPPFSAHVYCGHASGWMDVQR